MNIDFNKSCTLTGQIFNVKKMRKIENIILEPLTDEKVNEDLLGKPVLEMSKFDNNIGLITRFDKGMVYVYFGSNNTSMILKYSSVLLLKLE